MKLSLIKEKIEPVKVVVQKSLMWWRNKKIGSLIVITCICFGTGALYFPILISFVHQGSNLLKWATYSLVLVFALALFLFFLISFLVIKSYAKKKQR